MSIRLLAIPNANDRNVVDIATLIQMTRRTSVWTSVPDDFFYGMAGVQADLRDGKTVALKIERDE